MSGIIDLIDRAASDPMFLMELQRDPLAAARASGFDVSRREVRDLLGMPEATEGQLAEVLQARLSYSSKDSGCTNFDQNCSGVAGGGGGI